MEHARTQVLTVDGVDVVISAVVSHNGNMICYGVYADDPDQHRRLPTVQLGVVYNHGHWRAQHAGVDMGPYDTLTDAVAALIAAHEPCDPTGRIS